MAREIVYMDNLLFFKYPLPFRTWTFSLASYRSFQCFSFLCYFSHMRMGRRMVERSQRRGICYKNPVLLIWHGVIIFDCGKRSPIFFKVHVCVLRSGC